MIDSCSGCHRRRTMPSFCLRNRATKSCCCRHASAVTPHQLVSCCCLFIGGRMRRRISANRKTPGSPQGARAWHTSAVQQVALVYIKVRSCSVHARARFWCARACNKQGGPTPGPRPYPGSHQNPMGLTSGTRRLRGQQAYVLRVCCS